MKNVRMFHFFNVKTNSLASVNENLSLKTGTIFIKRLKLAEKLFDSLRCAICNIEFKALKDHKHHWFSIYLLLFNFIDLKLQQNLREICLRTVFQEKANQRKTGLRYLFFKTEE